MKENLKIMPKMVEESICEKMEMCTRVIIKMAQLTVEEFINC